MIVYGIVETMYICGQMVSQSYKGKQIMKEYIEDPGLILGRMVDPTEYPGDSQEDLNEELLMFFDQVMLLKYVSKRVGSIGFLELIDSLRECDYEFWYRAYIQLIKVYSLNPLKTDIANCAALGLIEDTINILTDIKVKLINDILEGRVNKEVTRDEFEIFLRDNNYCYKLQWVIKYIDKESFAKFVKRIFYEFYSPIYDDGDDEVA